MESGIYECIQLSSVQSLSCVRLFATRWTAVRQAFLSIITPRVYSNSCPLSQWCHPTISSSVIHFSSHLQSFPASVSFQMSRFFTSGGQTFSFNISPSNEYSGLISSRKDWLDLLAVQETPIPQNKNINSLALSFLYTSTLTSIHNYWKNHSFD